MEPITHWTQDKVEKVAEDEYEVTFKLSIVFCQGTYEERMSQTSACVERIRPYVDRAVIIVDESVSEESKKWLEEQGCEVYVHPWEDSMVRMRNQYLKRCEHGDWVIVSDPDELFCKKFCEDVRRIIEKAEAEGIGLLLINSHDTTYMKDEPPSETVSDFFKNLIFKYEEGVVYEGVGEIKEVHETLKLPPNTKVSKLPPEYYYEHIKYWHEVFERAARNVFLGGGGNNVGGINTAWVPLRELCYELGLDNWPKTREYLRKGGIDSRLKEWLWDNRSEGYNFMHEMMEFGRWYFEYLHPEEAEFDDGRVWEAILELEPGSPPEVARYIHQCYQEILGRPADQEGLDVYGKAILEDRLKREDLPTVLKQSQEYMRKHAPEAQESVRLKVPVNVDVRLSEDLAFQGLMRSETWLNIKTKLELAKKWEALMSIPRKVETGGSGADVAPVSAQDPMIKSFIEYAPPETYSHVLNIGAGAGEEAAALEELGYKVTGITFGADNVRYAKEHFDIDLVEMDMHNLQVPDAVFDAVFTSQTFEHSFAPWLVVLELRRVLRDGGIVFMEVPDPDEKEHLYTIWHTSVLYSEQVEALFWKAGFKLVGKPTKDTFVFEKLPDDSFEMWGYVKIIMERL